MSKVPALSEFAREHQAAESKRTIQRLEKDLKEARVQAQSIRRQLGLLEDIDELRATPPKWSSPKTATKTHVGVPNLLVTDTHFDEVVLPEEVDGLNAYNRRIAEARLKRAFEGAIVLARDYLKGIEYEGFNVLFGGDIFSGIIHEELENTNAATIIESVDYWVDPLEAGINMLLEEFGRVHVVGVPGNHGRRTRQVRFKRKAKDSFDWLLYRTLARDFRVRKETRVTFEIADASDQHFRQYGTEFLITHGDQFRGGSGISGAKAPLELGKHRKTRREALAGRPYDVLVLGHFHQRIIDSAMIVGGCLKGYDEYAYGNNFPPEPPQQEFWVTTPEHGVTFATPVLVADQRSEAWHRIT